MLLQLWCRPAAAAPIWPLAWELPYAAGAALKSKKKKEEEGGGGGGGEGGGGEEEEEGEREEEGEGDGEENMRTIRALRKQRRENT